jgi:ABC-2 type transport system permease protein
MRNVRLVIAHEFRSTVTKARFWVSTFLFPLIIFGLSIGSQVALTSAIESETAKQQQVPVTTQGYVDLANVVQAMPAQVPDGTYQPFASEAEASAAMQSGAISRYYVIPNDWLQTGDLTIVEQQFRVTLDVGPDLFQYVLNYNLTKDADLATYLTFGSSTEGHSLKPDAAGETSPMLEIVPYAVMMLFFFVLTMSSTTLLTSVASEKENRTAEVLLTSLRPRELMLGKVIGQGGLALLQMALWLGCAYLIGSRRPMLAGLASGLQLPKGFLVWSLVYFVMGYLASGSAMAAIGALAPGVKESGQFSFIVLLPLMIPLCLNPIMAEAPDGAISVALSLIPLTSPVAMPTRMASTTVPFWQLLLGAGALAAAACGFVVLAGRMFRADNLLSTAGLNMKRLLREIKR